MFGSNDRAVIRLLQANLIEVEALKLAELKAAPSKPVKNLIGLADGSLWNPGNGWGPYLHNGSLFLPFWGAWNDGAGSGLDADTVDGKNPTATPTANSIPISDANGKLDGWVTVALTKYFESTEQTITSAGSLTLAHGLGVEPKLFQVMLICKTAEGNYSINDKVVTTHSLVGVSSGNNTGVSIVPDTTNLNIRYSSATSVFWLLNKTTGDGFSIANANWKAIFRAWT